MAFKEIGGLCDNCSSWGGDLQENPDGEWLCGPCGRQEIPATRRAPAAAAPPPEA